MRLLISLIFLTTIFGCEKQREQVEKFVFDNKQISTKDVYRYEFDEKGRVKTSYSTNFMYMLGVPVDSATYVKQYEYNEKGQIVKVFSSVDSTLQTKIYNTLDSLIADYTVNNYGDTTRLTEIDYTNGRSTKRIDRILTTKFPENFESLEKADLRNYDTLLFITEFVYEGDVHTKSLSLDKNGFVTEEQQLIYENGRKTKTVTYSILGDSKYIRETTICIPNGTNDPDLLTIGAQGDTLGFWRTILQDQNKITVNHMAQSNMQDISYYDKNGRCIGTVFLDLNERAKTVYSYKYDGKGNLVEESNYKERINNAR